MKRPKSDILRLKVLRADTEYQFNSEVATHLDGDWEVYSGPKFARNHVSGIYPITYLITVVKYRHTS